MKTIFDIPGEEEKDLLESSQEDKKENQ